MKRINSIFSVLLLLASVSCVREEPLAIDKFAKEGATVPVVLSFQEPVVLQAETKAEPGMEMGIQPAISSIHVAVFGTDRYLKDYVSAYPCDAQGNPLSGGFASQNATSAYFLARLPISTKERVLHIIANGPSSLPFNAYENEIMQNLRVSEGNGAYWQRIVLPNGINILQTDGIPEQTADGEYIPTDATKNALSGLRLIRNFASITVTENASNFEIVSYTICNMPKSGAIAMYSTNHGDWVPGYTDAGVSLDQHLYKYVDSGDNTEKTYLGFPTEPDLDTNIPTTVDALNAPGVSVAPDEPIYVYERAVTNDNPPFILMAARYVSSGQPTSATPIHYYRLDLALENGYFPIYRDFRYVVNISDVSVDGFDNLAAAAAHNSGSNFSISLDTRTLPDISNGVVRLYIEQPNFDWVYSSETKNFWFKFLLNSATSGNLNGNVTVTEKEGDALASFSVANTDGADNQRPVNYTLNVPNGTSTLSSTLQLVGTYNDGTDTYKLVRMVTIRVFNAKEIHPTLSPATVADEKGQLTTLSIPLPWDLQASMFPMEILIEDSAKALNPASTENMPVKTTGIDNLDEPFKSLSGDDTSSYCFVRTLNWSEYQRLKKNAELSGSDDIVLTCDFETTKPFSSSTIYVYNKYFQTNASGVTTAQTTLTGDADDNIMPNRQTVTGTTATVQVKSTGDWSLSISLANGNVASGASLSPSSGSATTGQDVTVTLPANVTENAIRYLLTLTNTSASPSFTRTAYITQEGIKLKLTSDVTSVDNGSNSVTVTVESGTSYVLELLDPNGNVLSYTSEFPATTVATNHQVIIPENPTFRERTLTIRLRNSTSTARQDITVTQAAAVATLGVIDSEIPMQMSTARVSLNNSFPVKLKVFNHSTNELVYTSDEISPSGTSAAERTVTVGAHTGASVTYRVEIWRSDLSERIGNTITFVQKPSISITAASTSVKGNENTTVTIVSDFDWELTTADGATLSSSGGSATTSPVVVTVTMPVNYTTSDIVYTITAKGTGANASYSSAVAITHRKATLRTGQTVTFNTTSGAAQAYRYSTTNTSVTQNGITGAFTGISGVENNYMSIASNETNPSTMSMSIDNTKVYQITKVVCSFTTDNRAPASAYSSTSAGSVTWGTTTTWTGTETSFTLTLRGSRTMRMTQYVVTYTDYQWN